MSAHLISLSVRKRFSRVCLQAPNVLSVVNSKTEHSDMLSFPYESGVLDAFCPSAWNNSAHTGRMLIKFDIRGFFENL